VTWAELVRKLKAAGFREQRSGKGSHVLFRHAAGREIWIAYHASKDVGRGLAQKILREAGLK
jgi:predicted RNA binding protein YcfA (HicA-like mRNA interferase family)